MPDKNTDESSTNKNPDESFTGQDTDESSTGENTQIHDLYNKVTRQDQLQKFADWIDHWHITRILQAMNAFFLVVVLLAYFEEREERSYNREVTAWQLISTQTTGNSGKIKALEYLNFLGEPLKHMDLSTTVYLQGVNLKGADLSYTNFNRAILSNANFKDANLLKTQFNEALLSEANFTNANLGFASFRNAQLSDSTIINAKVWSADFNDANLNGAVLTGTDFEDASLKGAYLGKANIKRARNLTCEQLKQSNDWNKAYRDKKLACGSEIPILAE